MTQEILMTTTIFGALVFFGLLVMIIKMYKKAEQGEALVRTGMGGTKVNFSALFVIPVLHKLEVMDITLKTIVIARTASEGLICKDNMRADIKVTFFVRVNQTQKDVQDVAQSIGCERASQPDLLQQLFEAKFSEALKTVGKHFEFTELYNSRKEFKQEILNIIGTDLNGYVLDDCAIDYLEQTPLIHLDENNILDSEGIKKIIELTSTQKIKSNLIEKEKEKTIKQQNVEAQETILQLEKQLAENEERQRKEIETIKSREQAEIDKVKHEQNLLSEQARIEAAEQLEVAEQNREREVLVALKNKERTDAIETERVDKDRLLERTEKERIVAIAQIEKDKAVEEERKNIQDVIRERVSVEKAVVEEEEKTKDIRAHAEAERNKAVALKRAEQEAEESLVKQIKSAEADRQAAEFRAKQVMIEAEAEQASAAQRAEAIKIMADAEAAKEAAIGMAEAQVMEAKAEAREKEGDAEANVIEMTSEAEAKGILAKGQAQAKADVEKAKAIEEQGKAEARVNEEKYAAEAKGIAGKAEAMKKLDEVSRVHEEFKLQLETQKEISLAELKANQEIASSQASVMANALKSANIDIIGGDGQFFNQIAGAVSKGKAVDGFINQSDALSGLKNALTNRIGGTSNTNGDMASYLMNMVTQMGMNTPDLKHMTVGDLLAKLGSNALDQKALLSDLEEATEATEENPQN